MQLAPEAIIKLRKSIKKASTDIFTITLAKFIRPTRNLRSKLGYRRGTSTNKNDANEHDQQSLRYRYILGLYLTQLGKRAGIQMEVGITFGKSTGRTEKYIFFLAVLFIYLFITRQKKVQKTEYH